MCPDDNGRAGPMRKLALITAAAARELDDDLPPLRAALAAHPDLQVSVVDWDDPAVDWAGFDMALLRSTWDYSQRLQEFLDWAARVAAATTLLNPLAAVRWNTDKHYLHYLAASGVATVPSRFIEPGDDARSGLDAFLAGHECAEFVVKPAIGAGSRDAQRYGREERDPAAVHVQRLLDARRSVLLQPYLDRVDEHGESALIFVGGAYSHAIRKGPLLRRGEGPTRALFAAEHITPRIASNAERRLAERTVAAIPIAAATAEGSPPPSLARENVREASAAVRAGSPRRSRAAPLLYARVDLIHDAVGAPRVLELELTEPSLFFDHAPGSAQRFAAAVAARLAAATR